MPKIRYSEAKGLVQSAGSGVQFDDLPFATVQVQNTSSGSVAYPGVYTVSGNVPITTVMPSVASVAGGHFTFRSLSAQTIALTGSSVDAGSQVFRASAGTGKGSNLAITNGAQATQGHSVTLVSDGLQFIVYAVSGTVTYSAS